MKDSKVLSWFFLCLFPGFIFAQPPDDSLSNIQSEIDKINEYSLMHQNIIHTHYPDLRKISYADGTLTLKPSWAEGEYPYTINGVEHNAEAVDLKIKLFDNQQQQDSATKLDREMKRVAQNLSDVEQRLQSVNANMPDTVISKLSKHGKAISVNAAFSALPSVFMPGKNFISAALGHFDSHTGIAVGIARGFDNGFVVQGRYGASEGTSVVSAGIGFGF